MVSLFGIRCLLTFVSRRGNPSSVTSRSLRSMDALAENWAILGGVCQVERMSAQIDLRPTHADAALSAGATTIRGEVRFVSAEERTGLHGAITPRGLLAVEIADPPWFEHGSAGA